MNTRDWMLKFINFYPPLLGAGIRVYQMAKDFSLIRVRMKLTFWNKNYVNTHFGGSIYAMCDPFFMLILIQKLGPDYIVWDKAAQVEFIKPGRGTLYVDFSIPIETVDEIKETIKEKRRMEKFFSVDVLNEKGDIIARVGKTIYIRRKGRLKM